MNQKLPMSQRLPEDSTEQKVSKKSQTEKSTSKLSCKDGKVLRMSMIKNTPFLTETSPLIFLGGLCTETVQGLLRLPTGKPSLSLSTAMATSHPSNLMIQTKFLSKVSSLRLKPLWRNKQRVKLCTVEHSAQLMSPASCFTIHSISSSRTQPTQAWQNGTTNSWPCGRVICPTHQIQALQIQKEQLVWIIRLIKTGQQALTTK